jgi:hypothetical protein
LKRKSVIYNALERNVHALKFRKFLKVKTANNVRHAINDRGIDNRKVNVMVLALDT